MTPSQPFMWRNKEVGRYVDLGESGIWFEPDSDTWWRLEGHGGRYYSVGVLVHHLDGIMTTHQKRDGKNSFFRKGQTVGEYSQDTDGFHFTPFIREYPELDGLHGVYQSLRDIHREVGIALEGNRR